MKSKKQQISEIEKLVSSRSTQAPKFIKQFLGKYRQQSRARVQVAYWYRRLGLYRQALLALKEEYPHAVDLSQPRGEEQLAICRLLNTLGATQYAMRVLDRINLLQTPKEFLTIIGNIYLSNYQFKIAQEFFQKFLNFSKNTHNREIFLAHISLADCFSGLDNQEEAIKIIKDQLKNPLEPIEHFIAVSALGEYCLKRGKVDQAYSHLNSLAAEVKGKDQSADKIIWMKWWGVINLLKGNKSLGEELLDKTLTMFREGGKPESWLEVLYWQGLFAFKAGDKQPLQWMNVLRFTSKNFPPSLKILDYLKKQNSVLIINQTMAKFSTYPPEDMVKNGEVVIDLLSNSKNIGGNRIWGLTKIDRLISLLALAGKYGLSKYRLMELLWPEQLFSYSSLEKRMNHLIHLARSQNYEINIKNNQIMIAFPKSYSIIYSHDDSIDGMEFLLIHRKTPFTRRDLESFYGIKKGLAWKIIRDWMSKNLVKSTASTASYQSLI